MASENRFIKNEFNNFNNWEYTSNLEKLLLYTNIDKRKNNWIVMKRTHNDFYKNVIVGLLINSS